MPMHGPVLNDATAHAAAHAAMGSVPGSRRKNTVCLLGDSRMANCNYIAGNAAYALDTSWLHWAQALAGADISLLGNDGVGGETTTQILARVGTVVAKAPAVCFVIGGFNDFAAGANAAAATAILATVTANLTAIFTALNNAGIFIVYLSNTAYSGASACIKAGITPSDIWAQRYFKTYVDRGRFIDMMQPTTETTTGAFKTSASQDGIHLSNYGAYLAGNASLQSAVAEIFPPLRLPSSPFDVIATSALSSQVLANPLFNGTTGTLGAGITGTSKVAASWVTARTGSLTAVMDLVAGDESAVAQQATITSTANNETFTLTSASFGASCTVGDILTSVARIKVASATNLKRVRVFVQDYGSGDSYSAWGQSSGGSASDYNLPAAFTIKPQSLPCPVVNIGTIVVTIEFVFSGAGGAVVAIERAGVFK